MRRGPYLTKAKLVELRAELDQQDRQVLDVAGRFRLVSGQQLVRLFTDSSPSQVRAMQRRTRRLVDWQVLDRLTRRVGGVRAGSAGHLFRLGIAGKRLREIDGRSHSAEPGERFVAHTLAISEAFVELSELQRAGALRLLRFDPEPIAWRRWTGASGKTRWLRPDAFAVIERGRTRSFWFIEIDLATESLPTIQRKMNRYATYLQTGIEQERLGGVFPKVLWHAPGLPDRTERLARAATSARGPSGLHVTSGLLDGVRGPPAAA